MDLFRVAAPYSAIRETKNVTCQRAHGSLYKGKFYVEAKRT